MIPMCEPAGGLPLYCQLKRALKEQLHQGVYPPGSRLPTEHELMKAHFLSRATVRQALAELEREGLIYREPGRGTFAATPPIDQPLTALTGFVEDMALAGMQASCQVLGIRTVNAGDAVGARLRLPAHHRVVQIERLRLANGQPVSLDVTFVRPEIGGRLAAEDLASQPIFSILEEKYGILLGEATYVLEAATASRSVARVLGVKPGAPIFLVHRTIRAQDGAIVEYERLHYRGDRIRYTTRLQRRRP